MYVFIVLVIINILPYRTSLLHFIKFYLVFWNISFFPPHIFMQQIFLCFFNTQRVNINYVFINIKVDIWFFGIVLQFICLSNFFIHFLFIEIDRAH